MTRSLPAFALVLTLAAATATPLAAPQESNRTQAMAKQLTDLMQAQKLDAIATRTGEAFNQACLDGIGANTRHYDGNGLGRILSYLDW